jgi:hypothetical protein
MINVRTDRKPASAAPLSADYILSKIQQSIRGRSDHKSGLPFGGTLLTPYVDNEKLQKHWLPLHQKLQDHGGAARDHPDAQKALEMQNEILKKNPELKEKIRNSTINELKDIQKAPTNPFQHMNEQQLYHHVMNMPHSEWARVQENAGIIAGKRPSKFGGGLPQKELFDIITKNVPGLHELANPTAKGGGFNFEDMLDKTSHLMDISLSRLPKIAAERLERSHQEDKFGGVLKDALWTTALSDLAKSNK